MSRFWQLPIVIAAIAWPAMAKDRGSSERLAGLTACAAMTDDAGRLACYDREVATLKKAIADRQIAIVEGADIRRSQREMFGVAVPNVKLFDDLGDGELSKLETAVTAVGRTDDGRLQFTTTEGAQWEQIDEYPLYGIKPGRKVTLKRAALGSFFAAFDKGISVRAKRVK